jgi:hypothetical protein
VSDQQNDHVRPAGRRRLRWAGLAVVTLVLITILGVGAVLGGLPGKLAGRHAAAHSTAAASPGQVNIPRGFVLMSVGGPLFHTLASIAPGDTADISATMDSRKFSPHNGRSVTRTVFTSVSVYEIDPASAGAPKLFRLLLPLCDADYMLWFLRNATAVTMVQAGAHVSQPDPADDCFNRWGVSNLEVDARWHFSSAPADPVAAL